MTPPDSSRRASESASPIGEEWPPFLLLAALTLLFLSQTPTVPPAAQMACILGGAGGLVVTIAVCRSFAENLQRAVWKAPTFLLLLLTAWASYRYFTTPKPYQLLATTDYLRVVAGTLAYFAAAYILPTARQGGRLIIGIAIFAVLVSFADFTTFGNTAAKSHYFVQNTSVLGLHMTVGGFLATLVPVIAALAFAPGIEDKPRLAAQLSFVLFAFALLLSRARSGWIGGSVALAVVAALLGYLALREQQRRGKEVAPRRRKEHPVARILNSPLLFVGLGLIALIVFGGVSGVLNKRADSVRHVLNGKMTQQDNTFLARLNAWRGALLMIREKAVIGRGLGAYMVEQGAWTHTGDDATKVLAEGTGHQNRAHNYYLQWAADTGLIGLFLHIAFLAAWILALVKGLPLAGSPERRAIAIGAAGAATAAFIDAFASPMYHLHGNYALFLTWLGLGLGALRTDPPRHGVRLASVNGEGEVIPPSDLPAIREATPIWHWLGAAIAGGAAAYLVLFLGNRIVAEGKKAPLGDFRVEVIPTVWQVPPGTPVVFKSVFTDADGTNEPTLPGTEWTIYSQEDLARAPGAGFVSLDTRQEGATAATPHAGLRLVPPPGNATKAITVFATYRDRYGRLYKKAATVAVRQDAPRVESLKLPGWRSGADIVPQVAPSAKPPSH